MPWMEDASRGLPRKDVEGDAMPSYLELDKSRGSGIAHTAIP